MSLTLGEAAKAAGGRVAAGDPGAVLGRCAVDSRDVGPGDFFVALKGEKRDGHEFLADVAARGATGALVSRAAAGLPAAFALVEAPDTLSALQKIGAANRRKSPVRVVGITGSNGKTTTKEMSARALAAAGGKVFSTKGNRNSQVGLPLMLLELGEDHAYAVLEMGASAKGNIARLAELAAPDVAILTNVGRAHLETFGSLEGVADAKWELAAALPKNGLAILNADDPRLMARAKGLSCSVATFGIGPKADVRAENIRQDPNAVFDLTIGGMRREVRLPVSGTFNVYNALAAAALAVYERIPLNAVIRALSTFEPPKLRMEVHAREDGAIFVLDAYNANPTSMKASLESFSGAFANRRRLAVLGSMLELGPAAREEHAQLGRLLARLPLDGIYFTGPEAGWVAEGYRDEGGAAPLSAFSDKGALLAALRGAIDPKTALLFKASRGVALEEVFGPLLDEQ